MTTLGSLFTGYGGLDQAVHSVIDAETVWVSDNAKHAQAIEAHHWPGVPNLGDISAVDWRDVEPVDVLTGGFPCQDVSYAGRRAGMQAGNRSGLWSVMASAIEVMRPSLVVIENVRGLLSAKAAHAESGLESCPWCVGTSGAGKPALRALGAVLGSLADLGYDASWHGLTAASIGAPHRRYRIFVTAWPADANRAGLAVGGGVAGHTRPQRPAAGGSDPAVADAISRVRDRWAGQSVRGPEGRAAAGWSGEDPAADAGGLGRDRWPSVERGWRVAAQRIQAGDHPGDGGGPQTAADADRRGRERHPELDGEPERSGGSLGQHSDRRLGAADAPEVAPDAGGEAVGLGSGSGKSDSSRVGWRRPDDHGLEIDWGQYEPAIREWEARLGRRAPNPTMEGVRGGRRLSPPFVEWLMGLPQGWVTDVPGLTRNEKLKALGNGVVPQQAEAALRILLPVAVAA